MKHVFIIIIVIGCFAAATFLNFRTSSAAMDEGDFSLSALMLSQAGGEDHCFNRPGENTEVMFREAIIAWTHIGSNGTTVSISD